jgi:transposase
LPSHPIVRGRAGPILLSHILFCNYGLHLPLHRQSATYAREGVDLEVSTLADWVGAASATPMPLAEAIRAHVFAAERIHADDTTVPVLAKGKTPTCGTTVRLPGPRRRRRRSSIPPTAAACILTLTSRPTPALCRPTLMRASTASTKPAATPAAKTMPNGTRTKRRRNGGVSNYSA